MHTIHTYIHTYMSSARGTQVPCSAALLEKRHGGHQGARPGPQTSVRMKIILKLLVSSHARLILAREI